VFSGPDDESGEISNGAKACSSFSLLIFGVGENGCSAFAPLGWHSVILLRSGEMRTGLVVVVDVVIVVGAAAFVGGELDERRMWWWFDAGSARALRRSIWHACLDD